MSAITINVSGLTEGQFQALNAKLDRILSQQVVILQKEQQLIMTEAQALAAIKAVADLTTKVGVNVGAEADTLQKVKDGIDRIIAGSAGQVPQSVADALAGLASTTQSVSDNLDTHGQILQDILAKEEAAVPTTPVPEPTPAPPSQ